MYHNRLWLAVFSIAIILSMVLAGCSSPAPATTTAPQQPTEVSVAEKPTQPPAPTAVPQKPTEAPAASPTQPPAGPKVVTISFTTGDPESLNPIYASTWIAECVFDLIYLPLWNIDKQMNYQMELAEELPTLENGGVSADGLTITIKLRKDAVWSDGTPVTADDAVFTYDMIMNDKNSAGSRYPYDTYVKGMTAVDANTLKIELTGAYADWSTSLFTGISRILPKHVLDPVFQQDGTLDNAEYNRLPTVTNGPFLIKEFVPASHLSFEANDQYWRGRPKLDKIFFRLVEDRAAQLAALSSGQADIGSYIIGSELPDIQKMGNMDVQTADNGYQVVMFLNVDPKTASPGMDDPKVRQAIAMGIDRQLIIDQVFNGLYQIPSTFWYGTQYDNPDLKPYAYDPEGAKKLLDEAGWKEGSDGVREKGGKKLALRYAYVSGDQSVETQVVNIQQMLKDIGIQVDLQPNTQEVLWANYTDNGPLATGQYDLTQWSDGMWYFPSPDSSYFLCSQIPTADSPDGYNWFGICDPKLDELFAQQAVEIDPQKRIEEFHEIGKIMFDNTLIIPLHNDPDVWAINNRLANIKFSGVDPLMWAYEWDVK